MIDLENDIFTYVANRIRAEYPDTFIAGEYIEVPASFPAVTIVEADNSIVEYMRSEHIENAVRVMYDCAVYSNKISGKKAEAKAIADAMDRAFESAGFTRTFRDQVANMRDATIYRLVIRYEGIIGLPGADGKYLIYFN